MIAEVLSPYTLTDEGYTAAIGEYDVQMWAVRASLPAQMLPEPNLAYLVIECSPEVLAQIEADERFAVLVSYE